jgi:hypothetical protein
MILCSQGVRATILGKASQLFFRCSFSLFAPKNQATIPSSARTGPRGSCSPHCNSKDTLVSCRPSLFLGREPRKHNTHKKKLICVRVPKLCGLNLIDANPHSQRLRWRKTKKEMSHRSPQSWVVVERDALPMNEIVPYDTDILYLSMVGTLHFLGRRETRVWYGDSYLPMYVT